MATDLDVDKSGMNSSQNASSTFIQKTRDLNKQLITISLFPSLIVQLEAGNYLLGKAQVLPLLHGHKLDSFVLKEEPSFMEEIIALGCEVDTKIIGGFSLDQQLRILQDEPCKAG